MKKWVKSCKHATNGILYLLKNERNFKIHTFCFMLVLVFSFFLHISLSEFIVVMLCSSVVFTAEAINTAIEKMLDEFHPEIKASIGLIKDISASSVLIAALFSAFIAAFIFIPKIIDILF
jgi:diacylglycerol kinase